MISASEVMELRKMTGAGMMECKKALTESNGDREKAIEWLQDRGIAKAAKKQGRIAAEGLVEIYVSDDKKVAAMVEVNAETDFVSKNEEFRSFVANIARQVAENNPKDVEALLAEKWIEDDKMTVQEVLTAKIAKIGENMTIRRFERFETDGEIATYIHGDGKIGVMVDVTEGDIETGKDICMQIAAIRPEYLDEKDVPEERVNKQKEILKAQVINEGRPENIADRIVTGRLGKFFEEICLMDQAFVKDGNLKVKDVLKNNKTNISRFVRFEKGEGIEKKEENFAEEVAKQIKN